MTRRTDRRSYIVRIRTVEHRIAQQELALARRDARQIGAINERIEALADSNRIAVGTSDGVSLAATSEMAMRLEQARRSTAAPLDHAMRQVSLGEANSIMANIKAERANRLLQKTAREESARTEARENSARCFRPVTLGDES